MNISLIGMMGAGKSTVARVLFEKLNSFSLVDIDELIERREKCSINEIFKNKGEKEFRRIESEVLLNTIKDDNLIISTGGGIVTSEININLLLENSVVFYLSAPVEVLVERLLSDTTRPLLSGGHLEEKIYSILNKRLPLYKTANYVIDTFDKTPDIIADEIIKRAYVHGNC